MDLPQGMGYLQGMQRATPAQPMMDFEGSSARVGPLSQMDYRMLQNGLLGRSPSSMELSQSSSQFQGLSGSAQLVGTVAALQEESGQLRCQWKSDVARLERELGQLRSAATLALPMLGGLQQQPEPYTGGHLQQQLMLQASASQGSMPLIKALVMSESMERQCSASTAVPHTARTESTHCTTEGPRTDRDQLLNRIEDLERQRNNLEIQRDQAYERTNLEKQRNNLEEALLCQMRESSAVASPGMQMGYQNQDSPAPARSPLHLRDTLAGTVPSVAPEEPTRVGLAPEVAELYQELERMESELRKVREENVRLKEEKGVCETAHSRDVATLEAMLSKMMEDNQRFAKALSEAEAKLCSEKKPLQSPTSSFGGMQDHIVAAKKFEGVSLTPHSIRSVSEPAFEPDIERSIEFGREPVWQGAR